jgi:small subunit ribosomal protein S16
MLKIRMQRVGRINSPSYRIVVTEHTASPKAGKFVEKIGTYNPTTKARAIDAERVKYWMSVGAKPSATMHNMLISAGIITGKKLNVLPKKTVPKKEEVAAEAPAPAAEAAETPAAEAPAAEETPVAEEAPVAAE